MALRKCPRCELNYILDEGALCTVCREEIHGRKGAEGTAQGLCSVCGEAPALAGRDMCRECMKDFLTLDIALPDGMDDDGGGIRLAGHGGQTPADDLEDDDLFLDDGDEDGAGFGEETEEDEVDAEYPQAKRA